MGDLLEADWRAMVDTNVTGLLLSMRAEIAQMRHSGGAIANIASNLGARKASAP